MKTPASILVILCFFISSVMGPIGPIPLAQAQASTLVGKGIFLPAPGEMIPLSSAYTPVLIKGVKIHPDNPLLFDFILDSGHSGLPVTGKEFKAESQKLIKYFLTAMTIKEDDLWVNLSPYEKDRTVPKELGRTELGRDMLAQDYILKQLTASLIYPEKDLGKKFWDKVYAQAREQFGTTNIPVNTFNKVWIVADKAKVFEKNNTAFVIGAHLKVMLEEDYLSLQKHTALPLTQRYDVASIGANIVREIVLPQLEREVNEGKNFASLRQMFYSMILSSWYKKAVKEALLNQVYANKAKINGVQSDDPAAKEKIYQRYLQAYKKGVFNYIKEDVDFATLQTVPRKYFSGGTNFSMLKDEEIVSRQPRGEELRALGPDGAMVVARTQVEKTEPVVTIKKKGRGFLAGLASSLAVLSTVGHPGQAVAQNNFSNFYQASLPYIALFQNSALTNGFYGFTRSFQGAVPTNNVDAAGQYGASSYDLTILGRIQLYTNNTTIIDTFMSNFNQANNVLFSYNNGYTDASGKPLNNFVYNLERILGRDVPNWWNTWDWSVEEGGQAELINLALDAYRQTGKVQYLNFAETMGDALLQLQDTDGGFRFGPVGVYHPSGNSFFWNLKSTEKNERIYNAMKNLYSVTNNTVYGQAAANLQKWLESMYDKTNHLFSPSEQWNGTAWVQSPLGVSNEYFPTDPTAMAPSFIFTDPYFGATQAARDTEIGAMFNATEKRTAFTNALGSPVFFKFSESTNNFGSVEMSSQMALEDFRALKFYYGVNQTLYTFYYNRYSTMVSSLKNNFLKPSSQYPADLVAPYASYYNDASHTNGSVAGGVPTGTGYTTEYYEAALASTWSSFAINGFDPEEINGGSGIPSQPVITSIKAVPGSANIVLTIANPIGVTGNDIYSADSLSGANWVQCATNISTSGTITQWMDTRPQTSQRFYKAAIHNPFVKSTALEPKVNSVAPSEGTEEQVKADKSALANPKDWKRGGIDLNSKNMRMDVDGQKIDIKFDPAMIAEFKQGDFSGVHPVIISIQPMTDLSQFLGLNVQGSALAT